MMIIVIVTRRYLIYLSIYSFFRSRAADCWKLLTGHHERSSSTDLFTSSISCLTSCAWQFKELKRPHRHEDLTFCLQGPIKGRYRQSCFLGSFCLYTYVYTYILYIYTYIINSILYTLHYIYIYIPYTPLGPYLGLLGPKWAKLWMRGFPSKPALLKLATSKLRNIASKRDINLLVKS